MKRTLSTLALGFAGIICLVSALYLWNYCHRQGLQSSAETLNQQVLQEVFTATSPGAALSAHAATDLRLQPAADLQRYGQLIQLEELSSSFDMPAIPGTSEAVMRTTSRAHLLLGTVEVDTQAVYRDGQWWFTEIVMRAGGRAQ